jgi:hypothetical protein
MPLYRTLILSCLLVILTQATGQTKSDQISIDKNGVMRWSADGSEIHGFGVNYTLPFAHEYRMANRAGVSHETAIRQDVYHMARLDLDLYRVHVWDTEICDTLGNLISNDHLRLFDFAVNEMKQRGMRFVITPIAFWGDGWPEPDSHSPGFSNKYGKEACLTNPAAIKAQANYLNQFLNHVNQYTGIAYKDDPSVLAFEISNEPHHGGTVESVTAYINTMVASMRQTKCTKPIFYNMSHSIHLAEAYFNSNIQGGTFQWYPTNLVANQQINGNFLPHVQQYNIPYANHPKFKKMAKIVYEFDPADVGGNIMYPAMARTFRETGLQLATQFAYDAMCWAPYNTNYGTHFMNLAYAPRKAISLKIASAVFHNVPLYEKSGANKNEFHNFKIDYNSNLAEWVTDEKFFYTNNTASQPSNNQKLKEIAGCGTSPLVAYNGTGAYFLDKISEGVWRLEVMPDAYWVNDPYSKTTPNIQKAAVQHAQRQININLPNLGNEFSALPVDNGNTFQPQVKQGQFDVMPGVYVLTRKGIDTKIDASLAYKNIKVGEYVAPASNLAQTTVWNRTATESASGKPVTINFEVASPSPINKISVVMSMGQKWKTIVTDNTSSNSYALKVPSEMLATGFLQYRIIVDTEAGTYTYPHGQKGNPWSWESSDNTTYTLRMVPESSPLVLWEAQTDWEASFKIWNPNVTLKPTNLDGTALSIEMAQLPNENPLQKEDRNYAFKFYFGNKTKGRSDELAKKSSLVIKTTNSKTAPQPIEIGLIDKNGSVVSAKALIDNQSQTYRLVLNSFAPASFLVIPRPYPDFLAYSVETNEKPFDWTALETLQVIVKPGQEAAVDLLIEKIWLE